jgi:hypothetical protein
MNEININPLKKHNPQNPEYRRKYYREHKEQYKKLQKNWVKNNPEKVRESKQKYYRSLKLKIFELLGNKCSNPNCLVPNGCTNIRCLQIDHVHGGGQIERHKFPSHKMFYLHVLKQIKLGSKDYQLLCANCNWIKRWENNE